MFKKSKPLCFTALPSSEKSCCTISPRYPVQIIRTAQFYRVTAVNNIFIFLLHFSMFFKFYRVSSYQNAHSVPRTHLKAPGGIGDFLKEPPVLFVSTFICTQGIAFAQIFNLGIYAIFKSAQNYNLGIYVLLQIIFQVRFIFNTLLNNSPKYIPMLKFCPIVFTSFVPVFRSPIPKLHFCASQNHEHIPKLHFWARQPFAG